MRQYEMFELSFQGAQPEGSFADIDLEAVFRCRGEEKVVKGFYAGDGVYKVRFLPEKAGSYSWKVTGVAEQEGEALCESADESCHGMVGAEGMHFAYEDGTLFYPFGTTVYALMHQEDRLVAQTMESLKAAPFNKVRFCVFPKHYDFNHNEPPCFAFEKREDGSWDVDRPCFAFWERLEGILAQLRMGDELVDFCSSEFVYQGHCGEEAYLTFYDRRTCAEDVLELPEAHKYRVELIDTWDMTRTVLLENAGGKTKLTLPGKEGMAVLARKVD